MNLDIWAKQWSVAPAAIQDLRRMLGVAGTDGSVNTSSSEAAVQSAIRSEASKRGARLWRNNVGATYTPEGSFIRYGLANDSSNVNKVIKHRFYADKVGRFNNFVDVG